ncbi:SRPBCC family protein [Spongiimicrobium sp. 3-5]|uniref:SRPBCC family protein n=1 Tax=Spongiimicrobium sp. 3-5 TaxID=3332596 RepID=UPI0039817F48
MQKTTHFIGAKTTREKMFQAIATPEGLQKWWASSASGSVAIGEMLQLDFKELTTLFFRCDALVTNEHLVLTCFDSFKTWNDTQLVFDIEEKEGQVFLTHTHQNIAEEDQESLTYFTSKWTVYLLSLKQYLETGEGTPYPTETKLYHGD